MNTLNRGFRLLNIYEKLFKNAPGRKRCLKKQELATNFNVSEKTIQRDIDDLRAYFSEPYSLTNGTEIKYSKSGDGYYIDQLENKYFTREEVLVLCKILLESRAFCKEELDQLIKKLLSTLSFEDYVVVKELVLNEQVNYVTLKHGKKLLSIIWELAEYIKATSIIEFDYTRRDGLKKRHKINPVAIMFSEYFFYLIAYMADSSKDSPTVFRVDRIDFESVRDTKMRFKIPYADKFSEGEFRKRVQFMYSGPLRRVKFEYRGSSIESVLDRLPTAKILAKNENVYTLTAEVYGNGIDMWLRSQGDDINRIE